MSAINLNDVEPCEYSLVKVLLGRSVASVFCTLAMSVDLHIYIFSLFYLPTCWPEMKTMELENREEGGRETERYRWIARHGTEQRNEKKIKVERDLLERRSFGCCIGGLSGCWEDSRSQLHPKTKRSFWKP